MWVKGLIIKLKLNRMYKASVEANEKVLGRHLSDGEKAQLRFACAVRLYGKYNKHIKPISQKSRHFGKNIECMSIDEWVNLKEELNNVG